MVKPYSMKWIAFCNMLDKMVFCVKTFKCFPLSWAYEKLNQWNIYYTEFNSFLIYTCKMKNLKFKLWMRWFCSFEFTIKATNAKWIKQNASFSTNQTKIKHIVMKTSSIK